MTTPLEPFGYFRSTPFGWEDCSDKDDGAKALYEITPDQALEALGWFSRLEIAQERISELERDKVSNLAQLGDERRRALDAEERAVELERVLVELVTTWHLRAKVALPVDAMLINMMRRELSEALTAVKPKAPNVCKWIYRDDPDRGFWEGSCGITWMFPDGNPKENDVHFCPKCGKPAGQEEEKA
ncbi:MAG: hypothetical protein IPO08_23310 [Xanthomonadales bacterium]|nr:hypothetical protein [Xanthomonadales bacterium]